jgi:hypothetical protein
MVVIVGLFEGLGEEKEEKRMNSIKIYFICIADGIMKHTESY